MKIKQKKYLVGFFVIVFVSIVLGIWLTRENSKPANNFDKKIAVELGPCEEVSPHYVGISESQANDKAKKENRSYRVTSRDGEGLPVTRDYSPSRLNFEIQKGFVTKATCG